MEQLRLPLYNGRHAQWTLPDIELFTALLLELGPAPARDHIVETFGVHPFAEYHRRAVYALRKYYLPDSDAPVPYECAFGYKIDKYFVWLEYIKG